MPDHTSLTETVEEIARSTDVRAGAVSVEGPDSGVHYDIYPGAFELLLDRNMNYSSGYYVLGDEDLDTAQIAKMRRIAEYVGLRPGERVLDVGCGWSGPALFFAETYACHVTGVTLSPVQQAHGLAWAARRGLSNRLTVEVRSVLDLPYADASFDRIMFLESIIHMPEKDEIFATCARLLRPGGRLFVQESNYDRDSKREEYLSHRGFHEVFQAFGYSFHMASAGEMFRRMEEAGLVPVHLENISRHYVRTLSQWLANLDRHETEMRSISERAFWMLRRYLMIALATYRSGHTVCHMMTAEKPGA